MQVSSALNHQGIPAPPAINLDRHVRLLPAAPPPQHPGPELIVYCDHCSPAAPCALHQAIISRPQMPRWPPAGAASSGYLPVATREHYLEVMSRPIVGSHPRQEILKARIRAVSPAAAWLDYGAGPMRGAAWCGRVSLSVVVYRSPRFARSINVAVLAFLRLLPVSAWRIAGIDREEWFRTHGDDEACNTPADAIWFAGAAHRFDLTLLIVHDSPYAGPMIVGSGTRHVFLTYEGTEQPSGAAPSSQWCGHTAVLSDDRALQYSVRPAEAFPMLREDDIERWESRRGTPSEGERTPRGGSTGDVDMQSAGQRSRSRSRSRRRRKPRRSPADLSRPPPAGNSTSVSSRPRDGRQNDRRKEPPAARGAPTHAAQAQDQDHGKGGRQAGGERGHHTSRGGGEASAASPSPHDRPPPQPPAPAVVTCPGCNKRTAAALMSERGLCPVCM